MIGLAVHLKDRALAERLAKTGAFRDSADPPVGREAPGSPVNLVVAADALSNRILAPGAVKGSRILWARTADFLERCQKDAGTCPFELSEWKEHLRKEACRDPRGWVVELTPGDAPDFIAALKKRLDKSKWTI